MSTSGGGSGGSGTQKYEWNDAMAPFWGNALESAKALTNNWQMTPYQGQRIAGLTGDQTDSMNNTRHYINDPGEFLYGKGNLSLQDTVGGRYLDGDKANPFSTPNKYSGVGNPFFRDMMDQGMTDIVSKYRDGTSQEANAAAVLNGTLGGGDHQRMIAKNEEGLAKQLGQFSSGMMNDQYNRSAGLEDNYLQRGSQNYTNERGNMMNAGQMAQNDQGLTLQRYNAQMGIGDVNRAYNQDILNQNYLNFQEQQQSPYKQLDYMTGILSRAQGGMAPNQTTTPAGYAASPYSQILGGLLGGYAAMK